MSKEKTKADEYYDGAKELLKNGDYLKAAIDFGKAINEGFENQYSNGDIAIFYAALSRSLAGDIEVSNQLWNNFLVKNLKINHKNGGYWSLENIIGQYDFVHKVGSGTINFEKMDFKTTGFLIDLISNILPGYYQKAQKYDSLSDAQKLIIDSKNKPNESQIPDLHTPVLANLSSLIGLSIVKEEVNSLINVVKMRKIRQQRGLTVAPSALHMIFTGNPGTGKTTVARIIAEIYRDIGLLTKGHLVEVDRSSLVEKYVGHTAKKVSEIVESALGGILFIDEAYSLAQPGENDFGKEAIDALVKLMEDNRENLIVIVAGYTDEMQKFINSNTGLQSRFPTTIHFQDYSSAELFQIFENLCEIRGYKLTENASEKVIALINKESETDSKKFGNGRGVRNIFERIEKNQLNRLGKLKSVSDNELIFFEECDVF